MLDSRRRRRRRVSKLFYDDDAFSACLPLCVHEEEKKNDVMMISTFLFDLVLSLVSLSLSHDVTSITYTHTHIRGTEHCTTHTYSYTHTVHGSHTYCKPRWRMKQ